MTIYQNKAFIVNIDNVPTILGPKNINEKKEWLLETAKEEFNDFVLSPKEGNIALGITLRGQIIGMMRYQLTKERTIYISQYFIVPEYQKKNIGLYIINTVLPKLHPDVTHYEVLTRLLNDAAMLFYNKLGFKIGNIELVQKYGYDPLKYTSFYKNLK